MAYRHSQAGLEGAVATAGNGKATPMDWPRFEAVLFDLDGVVTSSARLHVIAWQCLFDEFLSDRADAMGRPYAPFDIARDYVGAIDGKPRLDGIRSFLQLRGIELAEGSPEDQPGAPTVHGLAKKKNALFLDLVESEGVDIYPDALQLIKNLRNHGKGLAVVSSSKNCGVVLQAAGLIDVFDAQIDGTIAAKAGLCGKPRPDYYLEAARRLGVEPARAVVIEDAVAGVEAGRCGQFGCVVGVDRRGDVVRLMDAGADMVVADLTEIAIQKDNMQALSIETALPSFDTIFNRLGGRHPAVFLDFDGTLTPIIARSELAVLDAAMRKKLHRLSSLCPVVVISGRARSNVEHLVGVDSIIYAGSYGFDISATSNAQSGNRFGGECVEAIKAAAERLRDQLRSIEGAIVEDKTLSVAVHYRLVAGERIEEVESCVDAVLRDTPNLRKTSGEKVFELRPDIDWDKGRAVDWIFNALGLCDAEVAPIYIGDDVADVDAFRSVKDRGIGILVGPKNDDAVAHFRLKEPVEVGGFIQGLIDRLEDDANDPSWCLRYEGFNPSQQGLREALCTVGNGYFATRPRMPPQTMSIIQAPTWLDATTGSYRMLPVAKSRTRISSIFPIGCVWRSRLAMGRGCGLANSNIWSMFRN